MRFYDSGEKYYEGNFVDGNKYFAHAKKALVWKSIVFAI